MMSQLQQGGGVVPHMQQHMAMYTPPPADFTPSPPSSFPQQHLMGPPPPMGPDPSWPAQTATHIQ